MEKLRMPMMTCAGAAAGVGVVGAAAAAVGPLCVCIRTRTHRWRVCCRTQWGRLRVSCHSWSRRTAAACDRTMTRLRKRRGAAAGEVAEVGAAAMGVSLRRIRKRIAACKRDTFG